MYISPNHPCPPKTSAPPEDDGQDLGTIERRDGEQLRVRLKQYCGRDFVWIQPWSPGPDGRLWPQRGRGVSIRINELADVLRALVKVDGILKQGQEQHLADRRQRPA